MPSTAEILAAGRCGQGAAGVGGELPGFVASHGAHTLLAAAAAAAE
jgi:hypothetical protein